MNESFITVQGYVGNVVQLRKAGEHWVAGFRLGVTPRKLDRATGEWSDGETQWYSVSAWRALGQNVATSLRKGDPVVVQGRLTARTWSNSNHQDVVAHEIEATFIGHDLHRGTTHFQRAPRLESEQEPAAAPVESAAAPDWSLPLGQGQENAGSVAA